MRLIAVDVETSGLDPKVHRITELGWVLWDTTRGLPLQLGGGLTLPKDDELPLDPKIVTLNGITDEDRREFGVPLSRLYEDLFGAAHEHGVRHFAAHNARFDRSFIEAEPMARDRGIRWIDTREDLPLTFKPESEKLLALAAEHGFINPFRHRAVFDALTCCLLLQRYPIDQIITRATEWKPVVKAEVSFEEKDRAKERGYRWQDLDGKSYPKSWVKRIRQSALAQEQQEAPFRVCVLTHETKED